MTARTLISPPTRGLALIAALVAWTATRLHAQSDAAPAPEGSISLHIAQFTDVERDALNAEFIRGGKARIAFACVPAGVLVLEPTTPGRGRDELRLRVMPTLLNRLAPSRIVEERISLQSAEDLCANARNL